MNEPNFSKQHPNHPGWFLWRRAYGDTQVVKIEDRNGQLYITGWNSRVVELNGWWSRIFFQRDIDEAKEEGAQAAIS